MRYLGVEVGSDGPFKCVEAYVSNRISVGNSRSVRSKLHNAKTVRLAAMTLLARHDVILVGLAFLFGAFDLGAPARLPGDLILQSCSPEG